MSCEIVIVGGGEHAKVVLDAIQSNSSEWEVAGYSCSTVDRGTSLLDKKIQWIGDDETLLERLYQEPNLRIAFGIGRIGHMDKRHHVIAKFGEVKDKWATIVHASSIVSPSATVGKGACVLAGSILNPGCIVGEATIINTGTLLEHDVTIGRETVVATGVRVGGGTSIGQNCFIGMGASIRDHVRIGERAIVGMGSVVLDDIEPETVVFGVPAAKQKNSKE
jgi:sugar O-acyltransferase (sialic acid O-acetyltransferase NeuD family)